MKQRLLGRRSGLTLPELIAAIVVIVLLFLLGFWIVRFFANTARNEVTRVRIVGPSSIAFGTTETYTVEVSLRSGVAARTLSTVQIFEDELAGDQLLDSLVTVTFEAGRRIGTGQFTLGCTRLDELVDDEQLDGEDFSDEDEAGDEFEIYGVVLPDGAVAGGTGQNFNVKCRQ